MRSVTALLFALFLFTLPTMAQQNQPGIGMMFQKDDGSSLFPGDFSPLISPTSELISRISKNSGPEIGANTITGNVVSFPLMQLAEGEILYTRFALESSADLAHAKLLQSQRILEFQDLFTRFNSAPSEHIQMLLEGTGTKNATLLVQMIIEGARKFSKGGPAEVRQNGVMVRFVKLN